MYAVLLCCKFRVKKRIIKIDFCKVQKQGLTVTRQGYTIKKTAPKPAVQNKFTQA